METFQSLGKLSTRVLETKEIKLITTSFLQLVNKIIANPQKEIDLDDLNVRHI